MVWPFLMHTQGPKMTCISSSIFIDVRVNIILKAFYFFLEAGREVEREGERRQSICCLSHAQPWTWPTTQACPLPGNRTGNPLVHRLVLSPLSYTSQGYMTVFNDKFLGLCLCISMTATIQVFWELFRASSPRDTEGGVPAATVVALLQGPHPQQLGAELATHAALGLSHRASRETTPAGRTPLRPTEETSATADSPHAPVAGEAHALREQPTQLHHDQGSCLSVCPPRTRPLIGNQRVVESETWKSPPRSSRLRTAARVSALK